MSGTATLSCTGAPTGAVCTVPASASFAANAPTTLGVSVSTTAPTMGFLRMPNFLPAPWVWATVLLGWVYCPTGEARVLVGNNRFDISQQCCCSFCSWHHAEVAVPLRKLAQHRLVPDSLQVTAASGATSQSVNLSLAGINWGGTKVTQSRWRTT